MKLTGEEKTKADRIDVRAGAKWWTRYETQKTKSLYPNPGSPERGDVCQQYMGNCFFLAAILAMALKKDGAQHIRDHLLDTGDEWVFGKLYDGGNKPRLMKARKQYCSQSDDSGKTMRTETSALWVCMLQIFASAMVLHNDDPGKVVYDSKNPSLTRLNDGYADSALKVLTGNNTGWGTLDPGWYTTMKLKHTSGYPIVISSKTAADLQQLYPGPGGALLNHTTIKGIVGGHAYAVWDIGKHQFGPISPGNPSVDALRILNPWGRYKQEYTAVPNTASTSYKWKTIDVAGQGDFWIPASRVEKFFQSFYYSEKALGNAVG